MRTLFRGLIRTAAAVILAIALYLAAASIGGLLPGRTADLPAGDDVEIALLIGPIHVDFLLPATAETRTALGFAAAAGVPVASPQVEHFVVGWGAREFYTTAGTYADITAGATLRAITGDASVLRIDVFGALPEGLDLPRLRLSQAQYDALLDGIATTRAGGPILGAGFTNTDGFVEAVGRFHILRTCNTWVSKMLREAGVAAGLWTPTPYAIRLALWRNGITS